MSTVTGNDLKELKDLITSGFKELNSEITGLKIGVEKLSGQITTLDERVSGLDKRLDILESRVNGLTGWLIGILFAFVGGLLGLLRKIAFFPNP
ncbi:MAG: hypothetical protein VKJ02_15445 [Snowella sp.]|nr:hypothetical protein [Snowella sp.]